MGVLDMKFKKSIVLSLAIAMTAPIALSSVDAAGTTLPAHTYEIPAPFTTANQIGRTHSSAVLRTRADWSNVNNPQWAITNDSEVIHQGQRVFCSDSWGWWELVRVPSLNRTGWVHGDNIRW